MVSCCVSAWMQRAVEKGSSAFSYMQAVSSQKPLKSPGCSNDLQALGQAEAAGKLTAQKGETDPTVCQEQLSPPITFLLKEAEQFNLASGNRL